MTTAGTKQVVNTGMGKMVNDLKKSRRCKQHKASCTQEHYVAGSSEKDKEPTQEYILLPLHPHRPRISVEDVVQAAQEKPSENLLKNNEGLENQLNHKVKIIRSDHGTEFKNHAMNEFCFKKGIKREFSHLLVLPIHHYGTYDDEDVGAEVDFNNMDNTIDVSPIPTLRVHKDHPKEEPKTISQALEDKSWVEAMQEELLQFKLQKVWIIVDLPFGKKAIGTKWVFRNKRGERSIVVKNKARLVAQGFRQEEGIDYDEVFAPVARIKAMRLLLAFV
ncbi:putative ribonuclease H-like domain-containing protein [Tanacetum coccineum]